MLNFLLFETGGKVTLFHAHTQEKKVGFVSLFFLGVSFFQNKSITHPFFSSPLPPKSSDEFAIFLLFPPHTAQTRKKYRFQFKCHDKNQLFGEYNEWQTNQ